MKVVSNSVYVRVISDIDGSVVATFRRGYIPPRRKISWHGKKVIAYHVNNATYLSVVPLAPDDDYEYVCGLRAAAAICAEEGLDNLIHLVFLFRDERGMWWVTTTKYLREAEEAYGCGQTN